MRRLPTDDWALAGGAAVLALGVRLAILVAASAPIEPFEYDALATSLLEGRGYTLTWHGTIYRSFHSAVPYVLLNAVIYGLTGHSHVAMAVAQSVISAGLALVIFRIGIVLFDRPVAAVAALLTALHPALVVYDTRKLHPLSLDALTIAAALLACLTLRADSSIVRRVATGIILGLGLFSRGSFFVFAFLAPVVVARVRRPSLGAAVRFAVPVFAGLLLVFGPWIARNFVIHRTLVAMTVSSELFWRGNNPRATGTSFTREGRPILEADEQLQAKIGALDELGQSQAFSEAARAFWRDSPGAAVWLFLKKLVYFFSTTPTAGLTYPRRYFYFYNLYYSVIAVAAVAGAGVLLWPGRRGRSPTRPMAIRLLLLLCIVSIALVQSAYYVETRHRWSVEPLILILAAAGVSRWLPGDRVGGDQPARSRGWRFAPRAHERCIDRPGRWP